MTIHDPRIIEKRKKNRTKREAPFDSVHAEPDKINEAYEKAKSESELPRIRSSLSLSDTLGPVSI